MVLEQVMNIMDCGGQGGVLLNVILMVYVSWSIMKIQ